MASNCRHGMPSGWCATCVRPKPVVSGGRSTSGTPGVPTEYSASDLKHLYRVDVATNCWIWIGEFRTYGRSDREVPIIRLSGGRHRFCGVAHNAMSRVFFEEHLGRPLLKFENVHPTCVSSRGRRHACVNPKHHEIRRGAGEMFGHDMQG
jgi:hypothetical protein